MKKVGNGPYDRSQIWDRIEARFFFEPRCSRSCFHGCLGVLCLICVLNVNLCVKRLLGMLWAGNGRGLRVH